MNFDEILLEKGIEEQDVEDILGMMKENGIFFSSEANIDIRYEKMKETHSALQTKVEESERLIQELQNRQGADSSQIEELERIIKEQQEQIELAKREGEIAVELMKAGVKDADYIKYKLMEGEDDGSSIAERVQALRKTYPTKFEAEQTALLHVDEHRLHPEGFVPEHTVTISREQFLSMSYDELLKFKQANPEGYERMRKNI